MFGISPKVYLHIFGIQQQAACMSYLYCFHVETVSKMYSTCWAKRVLFYIKTTPKPCCNVVPNVICFVTLQCAFRLFLDHYVAKTDSICIFYIDVWNYVLCITTECYECDIYDDVQLKLYRKCIVTVHNTRAFTSKPHPNLSTMLTYQCGVRPMLHLRVIIYQKCLTVHIFAVPHPV